MQNNQPLFALGSVYSTPGALAACEASQTLPQEMFMRHLEGNWSEMDEADQAANREAIRYGSRVFSAYTLPTGVKIWVITEADRSSTTMLLPEEY